MEKSEDEGKKTAEAGGEEESTIGVTHTRRCCCSRSCRALIWSKHICVTVRDFSQNTLAF